MSLEEFKNDYNWIEAFAAAGEDIKYVSKVIHESYGQNDGEHWVAIVEWAGPEGKYALVDSWCDYTGWDCRSGGVIEFYETLGCAETDLTLAQATLLGLPHDSSR